MDKDTEASEWLLDEGAAGPPPARTPSDSDTERDWAAGTPSDPAQVPSPRTAEEGKGLRAKLRRRRPPAPQAAPVRPPGQALTEPSAPASGLETPSGQAGAQEPRSKSELDREIVQTRDDVEALHKTFEALTLKVEALERTVASQSARLEGAAEPSSGRSSVPPPAATDVMPAADAEPGPSPPEAEPAGANPDRDINRMTHEDLRGLGLSVTQASRLISQREAQGGFTSLEQLDALQGFSRDQVESLKQAVTIQV